MSKKRIALLMAVVMVLGVAVGSTMAWLTSGTDPVVNTFTVGDINIELKETDAVKLQGETSFKKNYDYVPGDTLPKDPYVIVKATSEKSVVFVKVQESNNTYTGLDGKLIKWEVRDGWTHYAAKDDTTNGISYYYKEVGRVTEDTAPMYILKGDNTNHTNKCDKSADANKACTCKIENGFVTVNEGITKEMRDTINGTQPTLTFTAHAVQYDNIAKNGKAVHEAAWDILFGTNN